ncbi:MAG: biotin--[acetyl-CoA-carboxylase] ligase [Acidobacteria bacterium]|nr:biotin--[acetyl-CoA-carboxylase] ligase [Acidobacteriota bacterium]
MPDPTPADVVDAVASGGLPPVVYYRDVESTNDVALALASSGVPEFTAVLADVQQTGRGRLGRSWFSPAGAGLYLSVIVRPEGLDARTPLITLAAGVAVALAIADASDLRVELKWPNDVVIGRPWRKLAGILCEASAVGTSDAVVVVGIGVNLLPAAYPAELADRATSIDRERGVWCDRPIARAGLVAGCIQQLREQVRRLRADETALVLDRWRELGRAGLDGAPVQWTDERGPCRGIAYGLGDDGALLVRHAGRQDRLVAGDVVWERLSRV